MYPISSTQHAQIEELAYRAMGKARPTFGISRRRLVPRRAGIQPALGAASLYVTIDGPYRVLTRAPPQITDRFRYRQPGSSNKSASRLSQVAPADRFIVDLSADQCALAGMANACAARPLYWNIARFGEFQQARKS